MSRRANASYQSPNFSEIRSTFAATSASDSPPLRKPGCIVRVAFLISSRTTLRISHTRPVPIIASAANDVAIRPTMSPKSTVLPFEFGSDNSPSAFGRGYGCDRFRGRLLFGLLLGLHLLCFLGVFVRFHYASNSCGCLRHDLGF